MLEIDRIENQSNYYSYLSNLRFLVNGNKEMTFQNLQRAIELDTTAFCNELIRETYQYLKPNGRPHRRYNMPFLLDFDIDYYIEKYRECISAISVKNKLSKEEELKLRVSYIMLRDQWFMGGNRKKDQYKINQYEIDNHATLDKLYAKFSFSSTDKALRNDIYVLLLHSSDCSWTERWLKIYTDYYCNYPKCKIDMKYFLERSRCSNPALSKIVEDRIIY